MTQANPPHSLTRTVRLATTALSSVIPPSNGLIGVGAPSGLAAIGELEIEVVGRPADSGYLIDITALDRAVRAAAGGRFAAAMQEEAASGRETDVPALVAAIALACLESLPVRVRRLTYRPSPFRTCSTTLTAANPTEAPDMSADTPSANPAAAPSPETSQPETSQPGTFRSETFRPETLLTETFEFAAAHRLHLPALSDDDNRRLFGKCNNPNGHGHNYRIEVGVTPVGDGAHPGIGFPALERVVAREVMDRFDHKHLNLDCPEFRDLNPSVENIARVCHDLLAPALAAERGALRFVRVWETEKTSCRYPAE